MGGKGDNGSEDLLTRVFSRMDPEAISRFVGASRGMVREFNETHGDQSKPSVVFEIDPLPLILSSSDKETLETGVDEWGHFLSDAYRDLWSDQTMVGGDGIPSRVLWENAGFDPGFFRMLGEGASPLDLIRLDVFKELDGTWKLESLGTGVARGLGYALETRIVQTRVLGSRVPRTNVVRVAQFFQQLKERWRHDALTHRDEPSIMVWTNGPGDPAYVEHAYLARYFGYPLVESRDLTVRSGRVYLKMLGGLQTVDVLIRMAPDPELDPLSGSLPSVAGVAGLVQAVRDGAVAVRNVPGADLLESPCLLPYLGRLKTARGADTLPLSTGVSNRALEPFWRNGAWLRQPTLISVFAQLRGDTWDMMPGGFARGLSPDFAAVFKDVWVMSERSVPFVSLLPQGEKPSEISRVADIPSRVADDLFWLGRYAERAWVDMRYVEKWLDYESEGVQSSAFGTKVFLLDAMDELEIARVDKDEGSPEGFRLIHTLEELDRVSRRVGDRFSLEAQRVISQFARTLDAGQASRESLDHLSLLLAAFNGITTETMTRSYGWRFLDLGRRLERASLVLESLAWFFRNPRNEEFLALLLELFDSIMTYRARYRLQPQGGPVLDLLLLDETNPRSFAFQLQAIQTHVELLPKASAGAYRSREDRIAMDLLTRVRLWDGAELAQNNRDGSGKLEELLEGLGLGLSELSDSIHKTYLAKIEALQVIQAKGRLDEV